LQSEGNSEIGDPDIQPSNNITPLSEPVDSNATSEDETSIWEVYHNNNNRSTASNNNMNNTTGGGGGVGGDNNSDDEDTILHYRSTQGGYWFYGFNTQYLTFISLLFLIHISSLP
jgi:hypothetical protein